MVAALCTAFLISQFYRASIGVLGPTFMAEMGLSASMLGGVYFMVFAAAQVPCGVLLDQYGPRLVNTVLLMLAAAGAVIFATAIVQKDNDHTRSQYGDLMHGYSLTPFSDLMRLLTNSNSGSLFKNTASIACSGYSLSHSFYEVSYPDTVNYISQQQSSSKGRVTHDRK